MPSGFLHTHNGQYITLMPDSILDLQGTLDLTGATITIPANSINSTGQFDAVTLNVTGATKQGGVIQASTVTISPAAGSANVCNITITVKDGAGVAVAAVHHLDFTLTDDPAGAGLTALTASGTVTTSTGIVLQTYTAKKALRIQTNASGVAVVALTDAGKQGFYAAVSLGGKAIVVSSQLVTGSYG